jgi:hypothetical protein
LTQRHATYVPGREGSDQVEVDARHAELANLVDVVLPGLEQRQERLVAAIEDGVLTREGEEAGRPAPR